MKSLLSVVFLLLITCSFLTVKAGDDATQGHDTLRIMSYNIKLLPKELFTQHHHPVIRARLIPEAVMQENADVIVFQEAFDHVGVRILIRKMKKEYPYTAGFRRGRGMLPKSSGGVLMFSKYPILATAKTRYTQGTGVDRIGKKGAIMAEIQKGIRRIQIFGTHMQAGGTRAIKLSQIKEMAELGEKNRKDSVQQFYCGDFNINKTDTALYPHLAQMFKANDGDLSGTVQYTDDHVNNDMENRSYKAQEVIDFIFHRDNGIKHKSIKRYVKVFKKRWHKDHEDLSDHYALVMEMIF